MQQTQTNKPAILNLDKSKKYLTQQECFYLLNHQILLNGSKGTIGKSTPMGYNYPACEMDMPGGENYSIGSYNSILTNETYSWIYNHNGSHYIQRLSQDKGCEIVYFGQCLQLSAEPKHAMAQWRATLHIEKGCANRDGKQLIWTDGLNPIGQIDVEASIATNFFTTPFFDICADPCSYVRMCVPEICGCIQAEFMPLSSSEVGLSNYMFDKPFQFMVNHVYYDSRESGWSSRSKTYYLNRNSCLSAGVGLPRCLKMKIPIGNPMVEKIKIAFTDDGGANWYVTETVEKYKKYNNSQEKWYNREISELLDNYSEVDCTFDYIFCNNKERVAIAQGEITRVRNPMPRDAQGFIAIKDAYGFYNYVDGNCPLDKKEVEKIKINYTCDDSDCSIELVSVTVRAIIHNLPGQKNQYVWRNGGDTGTSLDDPTDTAYFGGITSLTPDPPPTTYGQEFVGNTRNFIVYIDGTDYWGEMEQWRARAGMVSRTKVGVLANLDNLSVRAKRQGETALNPGIYYFQEYKFRVPKGTKGFLRLASHHVTDGLGDNQNTSTSVVGIFKDIVNYRSFITSLDSKMDYSREEIYFDTCDGKDVDISEAFLISDMATTLNTSVNKYGYAGYVQDKDGEPIEGAQLYIGATLKSTTDHNGFYHFNHDLISINVDIKVELDCSSAFLTAETASLAGAADTTAELDVIINSTAYDTSFYAIVKQKVQDCDGNAVSGVRVSISGSKSRVTDQLGIATLKVRNNATRNRVIKTVVMNSFGCFRTDCVGECSPCMPSVDYNVPACLMGATPPIINMTAVVVNKSFQNERGLKSGGRYLFGIVAKGDCGKLSAAYELHYIDIPKTQEKGKFSFCKLNYIATDPIFPSWVDCVEIVRAENLNGFELQWIVDKIERTGSGKIILTIQSLNDYNERFFFKTNTIYQWLAGDRVEFISNDDGSILPSTPNGVLNYLSISPFHDTLVSGQPAASSNYFNQLIIEDDGRLADIKAGAIIEIQRPKTSTGEIIYREICVSIPVVNGSLLNTSGSFETFDTYLVTRISRNFLGYFEHHSPSDFWGSRVSDMGKVHVANQYENERRYGRNIILNSPNVLNRFDTASVKTFSAPEHGDITAMWIVDGRIILAVGENDSFPAQAANDLLRMGTDGIIRASLPDQIISDAEPKIRGAFGCQYDSIGSVYFGDGYARWVDKNKGVDVKHDYNIAKDVSDGKMQSFFRKRCQDMGRLNKVAGDDFLNHYRFITGHNKTTNALALTIKKLRDSGTNNADYVFELPNDTILFHPEAEEYLGFASPTPEDYGALNVFGALNDIDDGCSFVSYLNGIPYIHPEKPTKFLNYYGIQCDWKVGVVINKFPDKEKEAKAIEVQSQHLWFAKEVTTEQMLFKSEIPPIRWKKNFKEKWNAAFLSNINSRGGLYGTQQPTSYLISVLFIRDNTDALKYGTLSDAKRELYSELDEILFKFNVAEQSGFTENV